MKVTVISDTHNDHKFMDVGSGDMLIHCGDFGTKGTYTEATNFLWWFVKQPYKYKILVPGNHDRRFKKGNDLIQLAKDMGIHTLMKHYVQIEGLNIWGGEFVPYFIDNECVHSTREEREREWQGMPDNLDILITHAPPSTILDTNKYGQHCGCDALYDAVMEKKPRYHVFGHIHEHAMRTYFNEHTIFINGAVKDEKYRTIGNKWMQFNIDSPKEIEVKYETSSD